MSDSKAPEFSYEFFPPRSPAMERNLWRAMGQLEFFRPKFFSMTYGALGSGQQDSINTAISMQAESPIEIAAHLTCADSSKSEVLKVAQGYLDGGISQIVALRGDAAGETETNNAYAYPSACELVEALMKLGDLDISVAAYPEVHPQAKEPIADLNHLKRKLDAGANRAITQYFFDPECFLRFRDQAARLGIKKPIVPGILPIVNFDKVNAFSQRCGAKVPSHYQAMFQAVDGDSSAQHQLSLKLSVDLCERLAREGVDHFHFYTLNKPELCFDISLALGGSQLVTHKIAPSLDAYIGASRTGKGDRPNPAPLGAT